ncbi:MAG TPA: hypothetical protein PLS03_12955 [Terrimicrobiaceae bacterium]|nr:hypothetical protein [Terrimicrobiaceae bacterium]
MLALTSLAGCATVKQQSITPAPMEDNKNVRTPENLHDGKSFETVGALIIEERPLWKRILWPW